MKLFWGVMILVIGLAAVVLLRPSAQTPPPPGSALDDAPVGTAASAAGESGSGSSPRVERSSAESPGPPPVDAGAPAPSPEAKPAITSLNDLDQLLSLSPSNAHEGVATTAEASSEPVGASPASASAAEKADAAPSPDAIPPVSSEKFKDVVPARIRPGEDGWTMLDERFQIKGAGTKDDPYQVSWDLLVSASETYQPRMGKTRLPERITMLDAKYVRITGYIAFPIMAANQDEMLSMRNMWDGCCVGVPPTPYDAIEVKLRSSASGKDRFTSFGAIEGKFLVDPYVKGNWLLGLYLMQDAVIGAVKDAGM